MPRFSVVVPAYNASATLSETLDAVLAQEFSEWECVVVDDGSTDTTPNIAQGYCDRDSRFRLVRQENTGTAGAYRCGILTASSDLLVICSADDLLLPAHLRVMDELIRANPDYDIFSCNGDYLLQESGERRAVNTAPEWLVQRSLSLEQVIEKCFFGVGAVFRMRVFELTGGHRLNVYVEDYDFWLRAMARGATHLYTPQRLAVHRVSDFQLSADVERSYRSNIEVYEYLLCHESLQQSQRKLIEESIDRNRRMISDLYTQPTLERQAQQLRRIVTRLVGERRSGPVISAIHKVSWITRPARSVAARLRGRKG